MGDQLIRKGKAGGAVWIFDKQQLLKLAAEGDDAVIYTVTLAVELGGIINFFIAQERERVALESTTCGLRMRQDFRGGNMLSSSAPAACPAWSKSTLM